jgi:hypothetical protein
MRLLEPSLAGGVIASRSWGFTRSSYVDAARIRDFAACRKGRRRLRNDADRSPRRNRLAKYVWL